MSSPTSRYLNTMLSSISLQMRKLNKDLQIHQTTVRLAHPRHASSILTLLWAHKEMSFPKSPAIPFPGSLCFTIDSPTRTCKSNMKVHQITCSSRESCLEVWKCKFVTFIILISQIISLNTIWYIYRLTRSPMELISSSSLQVPSDPSKLQPKWDGRQNGKEQEKIITWDWGYKW